MKLSLVGVCAIGFIGMSFAAPRAMAEGGQTHGGTAVVCRTPTGAIARAEVLDVFEARELRGIDVIPVSDVKTARDNLLADLRTRYAGKNFYPNYLQRTIGDLHDRFRKLAPKVRLELINDVFPKISEKGCAIEQLASFEDGGDILLDSEIFDALTPLNRFALELHESAYYLDRKWRGATDSGFSRKVVGLLLGKTWAGDLDTALAAYRFDYPAAGRYNGGYSTCQVSLELRVDGAVRVFSKGGSDCNACFNPEPFRATGYADFYPDGTKGEWEWNDKKPGQNDGYFVIHLQILYDNQIQLGTGLFRRTGAFR